MDAIERLHLISTIYTYPGLTSSEVRDRANTECQHDIFEAVDPIHPNSVGAKLNAMSVVGLITGINGAWYTTSKGEILLETYLNTID